jgi:hypothetical protein
MCKTFLTRAACSVAWRSYIRVEDQYTKRKRSLFPRSRYAQSIYLLIGTSRLRRLWYLTINECVRIGRCAATVGGAARSLSKGYRLKSTFPSIEGGGILREWLRYPELNCLRSLSLITAIVHGSGRSATAIGFSYRASRAAVWERGSRAMMPCLSCFRAAGVHDHYRKIILLQTGIPGPVSNRNRGLGKR